MFGWLMPGGSPGPGSPGRGCSVARWRPWRSGVARAAGNLQSHRQRPSGERESSVKKRERQSASIIGCKHPQSVCDPQLLQARIDNRKWKKFKIFSPLKVPPILPCNRERRISVECKEYPSEPSVSRAAYPQQIETSTWKCFKYGAGS